MKLTDEFLEIICYAKLYLTQDLPPQSHLLAGFSLPSNAPIIEEAYEDTPVKKVEITAPVISSEKVTNEKKPLTPPSPLLTNDKKNTLEELYQQKPFDLQPLEKNITLCDLTQVRKNLQEKFPHKKYFDQIPAVHAITQVNMNIAFILPLEPSPYKSFLHKILKAIENYHGTIFHVSVSDFEEWQKNHANTFDNIELILLPFSFPIPSNKNVILIDDLNVYLTNPQLKQDLWKNIQLQIDQTIKAS